MKCSGGRVLFHGALKNITARRHYVLKEADDYPLIIFTLSLQKAFSDFNSNF